jgi:hypothetical protein
LRELIIAGEQHFRKHKAGGKKSRQICPSLKMNQTNMKTLIKKQGIVTDGDKILQQDNQTKWFQDTWMLLLTSASTRSISRSGN